MKPGFADLREKFKNFPRWRKIFIWIVFSAISAVAIGTAVLITLIYFFFGDDSNRTSNNTAVAFENGKAVFYQAELHAEHFDRLPRSKTDFAVYDVETKSYVWWLISDGNNGKQLCGDVELKNAIKRIAYGVVPRCLREKRLNDGTLHAKPLIPGKKYTIFDSSAADESIHDWVYFILSKCASGERGCVFLKTNSPATEEIRRNVMRMN